MKVFLVEYKIHETTTRYTEGSMYMRWDGTMKGMDKIKSAIAAEKGVSRPMYVEVKAMFECFGESAE